VNKGIGIGESRKLGIGKIACKNATLFILLSRAIKIHKTERFDLSTRRLFTDYFFIIGHLIVSVP
jgi:hypothetical protein